MLEKNDINQECTEIYREIENFLEEAGWDLKRLCGECYRVVSYEDEDWGDDERQEERYYQKYKKIFGRKAWVRGNAKRQTLLSLKEMQNAIYKTDKYKEMGASILTPEQKKRIRRASEELDREIMVRDSEE